MILGHEKLFYPCSNCEIFFFLYCYNNYNYLSVFSLISRIIHSGYVQNRILISISKNNRVLGKSINFRDRETWKLCDVTD